MGRRTNDSSNIKNLIFGGYEEPTQVTPQQRAPNFHPPEMMTSPPSTIGHSNNQLLPPTNKGQTLHISSDSGPLTKNMTEIEAKINNKLQEIESLFNDRPGAAAPIIIKNNSSGMMQQYNQENTDDNEENIYQQRGGPTGGPNQAKKNVVNPKGGPVKPGQQR